MPRPDDSNPWSDPDPFPASDSSPFEELPDDESVAPPTVPAYEVIATVVCWRCEYRDVPDRGRCRKCRARIADEDDDSRPRRRTARRDGVDNRLGVVILHYALFLLVSVVWALVIHAAAQRMTEDDFIRGTAVVEIIDTALVLIALVWVGRRPLADVSPNARAVAWAAAVPVFLVLLGGNYLYAEALRDVLKQNGMQPPAMPLTGLTILLVCVQPAIIEELFFRYVAFGELSRATGLHSTVFITAVMFAVAHIYNPLGMPYLFLAGVVFGYARVWGGLALPMVMHFFHNLAVLAMEGGVMTGTVVTSRARGSVSAVVWFVLAVLLVVLAFLSQSFHWGIVAILPFVLGLTAALSADSAVEFEIAKDGLVFHLPTPLFVPYAEIHGLTTQGNTERDSFSMQLYYHGGVVRIPAQLDVSSWGVYQFVLDQLPPVGSVEPHHVPPALRSFLTDQLALFGPEKVFVYQARPYGPLSSYGRHVRYSLAVAATGGLWIAIGAVLASTLPKKQGGEDMGAWIGFGVLILVLGLLFAFLFSRSSGSGRVKDWRNSCLVISPGGIAMLQGTLKGKLRWDELRAIDFPAKPRFALSTAGGVKHGVGLLVEGAYLIIADYYDRPLSQIEEQLRDYWGGRDAN